MRLLPLSCNVWFPAGQIAFREFLKSEYSEENILFWLACEEYKKIKTVPEMISSANRIFSEFVQTEAPKQVKTANQAKKQDFQLYMLQQKPPGGSWSEFGKPRVMKWQL